MSRISFNFLTSPEVPRSVSRSVARRAEALVRALTGVQDARVDTDAQGQLDSVHVVPAAGVATKAIVRNVQTALRAALNISIDSRAVFVASEVPQARHGGSVTPVERVELGPAAYQGARIELVRSGQDELQCRVVVEVNGQRRTGVAHAGEDHEGGVTLAARATLDALRHIEAGDWFFEGAADVIIGGQRHVVVSIRKDAACDAMSGAARVHESVEHAVALAVLNASGLMGAADKNPELRTVRQR